MIKSFFYYILREIWYAYKIIRDFLISFFLKLRISSKKKVHFLRGSFIDKNTTFEGYNCLGEKGNLYFCNVGLGTYIGSCVFRNVKIGRFCSIGSNVQIIRGKHPTHTFVSTHPSFFSLSKVAGFTFVKKTKFKERDITSEGYSVEIGNDVWIGNNVIIIEGVNIGDGAIIGAGAVITKNVEPYSINVGSPSKIIKYRFSQTQIKYLLNFKWWEKDINWINQHSDLFDNIDKFENLRQNKDI